MMDGCGRNIRYMRLSVTDLCNLRCQYCMPADGLPAIPTQNILQFSEIVRICRCLPTLGIHRIKLTGGEPLCRPQLPKLVQLLRQIEGIHEVTLTTNSTLLASQAAALSDAGIQSVNISMDSLHRPRYREITRRDALQQVLEGICAAQMQQMRVKINMVPMRGCNADELLDFLQFGQTHGVIVRFIGLMPLGQGNPVHGLSAEEIVWRIRMAHTDITPLSDATFGNGPAVYYQLADGTIFGIIDAVHHQFCDTCNRIRLSADGQLFPCLAHYDALDVRALLRSGAAQEQLLQALQQTIFSKPTGHLFGASLLDDRMMSQIGG